MATEFHKESLRVLRRIELLQEDMATKLNTVMTLLSREANKQGEPEEEIETRPFASLTEFDNSLQVSRCKQISLKNK